MAGLLRAEKLCKDSILHEISFEMESGEMLGVMGPSGSGKSTLLYQVAGMDRPSSGKVWLGDVEITGLTEDEKAGLRLRRMGFVFQQMNMMANLNLLDNILLPALQANRGRKGRSKAELTAAAIVFSICWTGRSGENCSLANHCPETKSCGKIR